MKTVEVFRGSSSRIWLVLAWQMSAVGCAQQSTEAHLAVPEAVHWEEAQLVVEGRGFPAGSKGELCLAGRWHPPDGKPGHTLERCVEAWAQAEDQVVAPWPSQGAFQGSLSLSFEGRIATVKGSLSKATFAAGAGVSLPPTSDAMQSFDIDASTLAACAALLLFIIAITRTRAGAGLFLIGQAVGNPSPASARALLIATGVCVGLSAVHLALEPHLIWLGLSSICLHPALLSWLRGQRTSNRSTRSLVMWAILSAVIVAYPTAAHSWPTATRLVLLSLGIYVLGASHCWLKHRRITDEVALGIGAWFVAQMVSASLPATLALCVCLNWSTLRTAPLFHWTRPSFAPCVLGLSSAAGLEVLGWLQPSASQWSFPMGLIMVIACVTRIVSDVQGSARQLSPIGAPDHTLPDLTLA